MWLNRPGPNFPVFVVRVRVIKQKHLLKIRLGFSRFNKIAP